VFGKNTSSQTIYIYGTEQTSGYSILIGGGNSASDRVEFTSPPADGSIITCDFTGYLRMRCRFAYDKLPRELFTTMRFNYGVELKGLGPA